MPARERVVAALKHQEPDLAPIDLGSNYCTTVNVIAYNNLKKHLGVTTPTYMRNVVTMTAAPQISIQLFGHEKLFITMAEDPEFVHYWLTFLTDALDVLVTKYLKRVGQYTTAVLITDDYGQQNGPQISPQMFRDLALWGGGITVQTTLHRGSIDDIKREVRHRLDTMKPGGGYVFSVDLDIQENVSPGKIEAAFEAAQKCRSYG